MKFLTINGKIQILGGKPIVVPDTYDNNLIKIGDRIVKTGAGLIGSKHIGGSGGGSAVIAGATFNDDAYRNMDGIDGDVFLTWEELKDPVNGELYMYDVSTITDTEISPYTFAGNVNLKSIIIPNSVTSIGEGAFTESSLTDIKIPDNVTFIGPYAFSVCMNLKSITIPNSVTFIDSIFEGCDYLKDINFNGTFEQLSAMESVWFGNCGMMTDYGNSIIHCIDKCLDSNTYEEIDCPTHGTGPVVTSLAIKTMPNKTAYFSGEYFDKAGLILTATWSDGSTTEVTDNEIEVVIDYISSDTTEIMVRCLHKICYVPITVRVITSLTIKTMPDKTAYLAGETFDKTGLVLTATLSDGSTMEVTDDEITVVDKTISSSRSYNRVKYKNKTCNIYIELLTSFALNSSNYTQAGITREGDVVIPETFEYNNKKYKVTSISSTAFESCKNLTSVTIPNSVTSIGNYAFSGCSTLTSISIPNSVTSIGSSAFSGCSSLTSITIPDKVTSINNNVFRSCSSLISISIPNGVTSIGEEAFKNCSNLTSITIPNSVTFISNYAFYNCSNLTSITIPNRVTSIGHFAFGNCSNLTSITISNNVTSIKDYTFSGCSSLTSITIPDKVTSIGEEAFSGCSNLTSITIPDKVTSIGNSAFKNCSSLTSITIPNSVTSINIGTFGSCKNLTNITIPDSVTSIGNSAFSVCSSLTNITIPNSVTSIGNYTFSGCSSLISITFNGTQEQWNAITKGTNWNKNTGNYTIYCTDGDIAKS